MSIRPLGLAAACFVLTVPAWPANEGGTEGKTPLHRAVEESRNAKAIRALLFAGAVVNARDDVGRTPLHFATGKELDPAVVRILIDAVDPGAWGDVGDATPVVRLLLNAGADPGVRDRDGDTPLHHPQAGAGVVRLLIQAGADVNATRQHGKHPSTKQRHGATNRKSSGHSSLPVPSSTPSTPWERPQLWMLHSSRSLLKCSLCCSTPEPTSTSQTGTAEQSSTSSPGPSSTTPNLRYD